MPLLRHKGLDPGEPAGIAEMEHKGKGRNAEEAVAGIHTA